MILKFFSNQKDAVNFLELQEAQLTTNVIYSGHLKSLLEEWATEWLTAALPRETLAVVFTWKCGRPCVLSQTQTFH